MILPLMDSDLQSIQEARDLVERAWQAWQQYRQFPQERIDAIVDAMAAAATANAERLARMAVEETTYGKAEDKVQKNLFASQRVHQAIRDMRTVGVVREDRESGITEIGTPVGVVAAVLPCTNPTSTAIYKILIALKAGNGIVLSPHPAAKRCICETVGLMDRAAREHGAPEGLIGCFSTPTLAGTQEMMKHRRTAVILATGGMGIVRAAYSSGKPAYGVGPGNVPAFIDRSANVAKAVADVMRGKSFDWGTICSSEQSIVAEAALREPILQELAKQNAYFLKPDEKARIERLLIHPEKFTVNPKCVGQSPQRLAEMAGFSVPAEARALVAELEGMGKQHPLSAEKLSPVLALFFLPDRAACLQRCSDLLHFGGMGHTCVIHATDEAVVREYASRMPAYRVVVNSPSPLGSIGATTNLFPAMTLGCGAAGGNSTSDNIGPQHLINIKRVAWEKRQVPAASALPAATATQAAAACSCQHAAPSPAPVSTHTTAAPDRIHIERIVDRFLAARGLPSTAAPGTCGLPRPTAVIHSITPAALVLPTAPEPVRLVASAPAPSQPKPVDFVCEADVRDALRHDRKIVIGPKTLLTPAARELGDEKGVFEEIG